MQTPAEKTHVHTDYAGYTPCHLLRLSSYSFFIFPNHPFSPLLDSSPPPPTVETFVHVQTCVHACGSITPYMAVEARGVLFSHSLFFSLWLSFSWVGSSHHPPTD